jgi:hypothetical protein
MICIPKEEGGLSVHNLDTLLKKVSIYISSFTFLKLAMSTHNSYNYLFIKAPFGYDMLKFNSHHINVAANA